MGLLRTMVGVAVVAQVGCVDHKADNEAAAKAAQNQDVDAGGTGDGDASAASELPANVTAAIETYADIVLASYEDTLTAAETLDEALTELVDEPSAEQLEAARSAWRDAREPYLQTEVYRFYDGPIDDPEDGPEGMINAWPMDEAYVDYVEGDPDTGLINDPQVDLDPENLAELNEAEGEASIATGYHPIEFMLWGQDLSEDGPGERPYTDFVESEEGTAANQARRGRYLLAISELLQEQLAGLEEAWAEGDDSNYRAAFLADAPEESLQKILQGMIVLSGFETGGERLRVALDTGDQEDEHSCFSDNTHRDMVGDVLGVQNVYLGRYTRLDGSEVRGPGIYDVVLAVDADLAETLRAQIADSLAAALALEPPFDKEIQAGNAAGRKRVQALIDALVAQEDTLSQIFARFGLTPEIPEG